MRLQCKLAINHGFFYVPKENEIVLHIVSDIPDILKYFAITMSQMTGKFWSYDT